MKGGMNSNMKKACLVPALQAFAIRTRDKNELNTRQNNIGTKSLYEHWGEEIMNSEGKMGV